MKSLEELNTLRGLAREKMGLQGDKMDSTRVVVGLATCGIAAGARPVFGALTEELAKEKVEGVIVSQTGCIGVCQHEPVVEVFEKDGERVTYVGMTPEKAIKVVHQHLIGGQVVTEFTIGAHS